MCAKICKVLINAIIPKPSDNFQALSLLKNSSIHAVDLVVRHFELNKLRQRCKGSQAEVRELIGFDIELRQLVRVDCAVRN